MAEIKSESDLVKRILIDCTDADVRLWRNQVGVLENSRGQMVPFGLCPGSADIIGLRRFTVMPEHMGLSVAQFVSIECKWGRAKLKAHQEAWKDTVHGLGGVAGVAYSVEDAATLLVNRWSR